VGLTSLRANRFNFNSFHVPNSAKPVRHKQRLVDLGSRSVENLF